MTTLMANETQVTEVTQVQPFSLIRDGETLFTTEVKVWNPSLETEISDFELTEAEGLQDDQVIWFVGSEIEANRKAFKLQRVLDKVNERWEDEAEFAKTPLPEPKVGEAKYPHVIRDAETGNPIIIKSTKIDNTGQDKFGVFIRCIDTGEVMRVWTSDLHQTCRTPKAKKAFDKARRNKAKKAQPKKVKAE